MTTQQITAHFDSSEQVNAALSDLRRAGAVCHTGTLPYQGTGGSPTLHLSVRPADALLARDIIRRSGGRL